MRNAFLTIGIILSIATGARGGFAPDFLGTTPSGPNTTFNYNAVFATIGAEETLIGGAGILAPGTPASPDFFTVYDIPGFVSATAAAGFTVQSQFLGISGPFQGPPDSPTLTNLTFRYNGPTITVDTIFTGISIVSTFSTSDIGFYSSQRTDNDGLDATTKIGETGNTIVPSLVPEPAAVMLIGAAGLLGLLRRPTSR